MVSDMLNSKYIFTENIFVYRKVIVQTLIYSFIAFNINLIIVLTIIKCFTQGKKWDFY